LHFERKCGTFIRGFVQARSLVCSPFCYPSVICHCWNHYLANALKGFCGLLPHWTWIRSLYITRKCPGNPLGGPVSPLECTKQRSGNNKAADLIPQHETRQLPSSHGSSSIQHIRCRLFVVLDQLRRASIFCGIQPTRRFSPRHCRQMQPSVGSPGSWYVT